MLQLGTSWLRGCLISLQPPLMDNHLKSVLGHLLNSSKWPRILRTDSAVSQKVSKRVVILSGMFSIGLLVLAVASSNTSLGLSSTTSQAPSQTVQFRYAQDMSPMEKQPFHIQTTSTTGCVVMTRFSIVPAVMEAIW
jgi:hypothetical protein